MALAAAFIAVAALAASAQDDPSPREAVEKARALEGHGFVEEARHYLEELVGGDAPAGRDPEVVLELARLTPSADEAIELVDGVIHRARDARALAAAHALRGDFLYAQGRYLEASAEYEKAARLAEGAEEDRALLMRARSLLAAGDASAAADAFRELAEKGGVPGESTPWAELGLGQALLLRGDALEAAAQFERTAAAYPDHDVRPLALAGAAESRLVAGEPDAARAALGTIVEEYPGTFEAVLADHRLSQLAAADTTAPVDEGPEDSAE